MIKRKYRLFEFTSRGLLLIMIMSLLSNTVISQELKLDFRTVETSTLEYYNNGQWDQLIELGQKAIRQGHDYYYLRLRMGIAWFNKTNYLWAIHHLEKALTMNQNDPVLLEYLYLAYHFSNRQKEALAVSRYFPGELSEKLGTEKLKILDQLNLGGGYTLSNNIKSNQRRNLLAGWDTVWASQNLNDDKYFFQADFDLNLTKRISVFLSYMNLTTQKLQQIQVPELVVTGHYTEVIPPGVYQGNIYVHQFKRYDYRYNMKQNSLYGAVSFAAGRGFTITPAASFLQINYQNLVTQAYQEAYLAQPWHETVSSKMVYEITERDTSFNNYIASLNLSRSFLIYNLGLTGSYSNLNGLTQYQGDLRLSWFPKGNLNFYGISRFTVALEKQSEKFRYMVHQLVGFRLTDHFWLEAFASFGEMTNLNESNGYIVYNSGDLIKFRAGANFIIPLSDQLQFSFRYHFLSYESWLVRGFEPEPVSFISIHYENQSFIGGITWKI